MNKEVLFGESQAKILKGIDITCDIVAGTLGPKGGNVYIDDAMQPKWTKDGATIATNVVFKDPYMNAGAKLTKNTCGQTADDAGDATTTTAVLLKRITHEALERPENPMDIRESVLKAKGKIIKALKAKSKAIDIKDIKKVALISAENEPLANAVSTIINKIGKESVITVEDAYDGQISYEIVEGYEAGAGFMSPKFINQEKRARCVMENVPVLVTDKKISAIGDIKPLWDSFHKSGVTSCVIVCDDIENAVLGVFVASKNAGLFNTLVIRATGDLLKDIEAAVGATRVSDTTGLSFQQLDQSHLGQVKKVISDANKTLFIPTDSSSAIAYANNLQKLANEEPNMYIKTRFERRISQLRGGIAVLKIGATDFQREDLKDKADDTIRACKSALEEGIVEGGGMTLWRIAQELKPKTIGEEILKKALTAPLRQIISNAGLDYAEIVNGLPEGKGYDAKNNEYVDMNERGILDPSKAERCAIENAIDNSMQFITGFASIVDAVELEKQSK